MTRWDPSHRSWTRMLLAACVVALLATDVGIVVHAAITDPDLHDPFDHDDGLLTHEKAPPTDRWEMTSGSLLAKDGAAWSGVPDEGPPDEESGATGSSVFRMISRRDSFGDVRVRFRLRVDDLTTTSRTPARDWDGVHVAVRQQSPDQLYYVSVARRDGLAVVKKKVMRGGSSEGSYSTLADVRAGVVPGRWHMVTVTCETRPDESVMLSLAIDGQEVLTAVDDGSTGGPAITSAGKVGIRGDNAEFVFDDVVVTPS